MQKRGVHLSPLCHRNTEDGLIRLFSFYYQYFKALRNELSFGILRTIYFAKFQSLVRLGAHLRFIAAATEKSQSPKSIVVRTRRPKNR
jgi:hypothetical protein